MSRIAGFSSKNRAEYEEFQLPGEFFEDDVTPSMAGTDKCVIAIADPALKDKISENLKSKGFSFPNFIHPSAIVGTDMSTFPMQGIVISPNCTIGSNVKFGDHVFLNFMVGVGHDCVFDGFAHVTPGRPNRWIFAYRVPCSCRVQRDDQAGVAYRAGSHGGFRFRCAGAGTRGGNGGRQSGEEAQIAGVLNGSGQRRE